MANIRETAYYKEMTQYDAVGIAEGFVEGDGTEEQLLAAWQYLHDTRMAYSLQGWFGRTAQRLISDGHIME